MKNMIVLFMFSLGFLVTANAGVGQIGSASENDQLEEALKSTGFEGFESEIEEFNEALVSAGAASVYRCEIKALAGQPLYLAVSADRQKLIYHPLRATDTRTESITNLRGNLAAKFKRAHCNEVRTGMYDSENRCTPIYEKTSFSEETLVFKVSTHFGFMDKIIWGTIERETKCKKMRLQDMEEIEKEALALRAQIDRR